MSSYCDEAWTRPVYQESFRFAWEDWKPRVWTPGHCELPHINVSELCPAGWTYVDKTGQGCNAADKTALCRKSSWLKDTPKGKAQCCLSDANDPECPPGFCKDKQKGQKCVDALKEYCKTQFRLGQSDNEKCWQWAKANWTDGIDVFCRDVGRGNGWGIEGNRQCKEYAEDTASSGKLDNAVTAYCNSTLGRGKELCSCFPKAVGLTGNSKELNDLGANLACWSEDCISSLAYKTKDTRDRMKNCGAFCGSVTSIEDVVVGKDLTVTQECGTEAEKQAETLDKQDEAAAAASSSSSSSSSGRGVSNIGLILAIGVGLLLLFALIIGGIVLATSDGDNEDAQIMAPIIVGSTRPTLPIGSASVAQLAPALVQSQMQPGSAQFPPFQKAQPQQLFAQ